MLMPETNYDNADFYDCRDSEEYTHESPEEALEELIDIYLSPKCDVEAEIRKLGPIKVSGYTRVTLAETWAVGMSESLAEQVAENFSEEHGDPNGDDDGLSKEVLAKAAQDFEPVVRELIAHATVWFCDDCGERTYSVEEILAMMREHRPGWFESEEEVQNAQPPI